MAKRKIKVLYFIKGTMATAEDEAAIDEFSVRHVVCIRNASMIGDNDPLEDFDVVAGEVPPKYAAAFEAKGPPVERETPKTPIASVQQGNPLAPEPVAAPEPAPIADAKPKAPVAKPGAAKGWKPNA